MKKGDFFKGVMQWDFYHQEMERNFLLPVFYHDNTSMTAIYTASADRVRELLPLPDMYPVQMGINRALVAFTAFEYRQTDIDPYNEFSISFPITFRKKNIPCLTVMRMMARRCFSAYVWQLPVTTEVARRGGVDFYGYPKFLADIEFLRDEATITCTLSEGGEKILALKGRRLETTEEKPNRFRTYSVKDGIPLIANVYMNPLEFGKSMDGKAAALTLGENHNIAKALKGLNLSKSALFYQYMPLMEAILYAPRNLMDD